MKYDPNNILPIGTKVCISNIPSWAKFNEGIKEGDTGTIIRNKVFEYTYVVKMDNGAKNQPVYSSEIEVVSSKCDIPNWDKLSIL